MRPVRRALVILLLILVVGLGAVFVYVRGRGFSARSEPGRLEESVARFARRLAIRVKTNPPVSVEVLIADQSMWGWLENLSLIGLGIYLPRAQIMHDPQDVFQKDMGLRIRLHPPTEEAPIELVGKVAHGTPQQGTYRLGINLSADAEAQRAIEGYIARRQAAIAHELQIVYDRMCARQSQRPLS